MSADVSDSISKWILHFLAAVGKILGIAMGVLVAWTVLVAAGAGLLFVGFRRRLADPLGALAVIAGSAIVMSAWPLSFSDEGLLGMIAPHSAVPVVGKGLAVQGAILAVLLITGAVISVRTHKHVVIVTPEEAGNEG